MKQEIFWLGLILHSTAVMWMPYILCAFATWGLGKTLTYREDVPPLAAWAQRAKKAHANAIENLALLAPATLAYLFLSGGTSTGEIVPCLQIYLGARVGHYVLYIANVPFGRTVTFLIGWACTVCIIWKLLA